MGRFSQSLLTGMSVTRIVNYYFQLLLLIIILNYRQQLDGSVHHLLSRVSEAASAGSLFIWFNLWFPWSVCFQSCALQTAYHMFIITCSLLCSV